MDETEMMLSVQGNIQCLTRRVCRDYSDLDRDELVGAAQIIALKAVRSYRSDKGTTLSTWVNTCLWKYFCAQVRSKKWRRLHSKQCPMVAKQHRQRFSLESLLRQLSDEASMAIGLALDYGLDRQMLLNCLVHEFAWSGELVRKVWREIREVLYD